MLLLTGTSDIIRVVTDAVAAVHVHASWVDNLSGVITPGRSNTASIVTATTTTVVGSPAASTQRNVKHLNITNAHASTPVNVKAQHFDGTNSEDLMAVLLKAGENLIIGEDGQWRHFDVNGAVYATGVPFATQADMEAASSALLVVSPAMQHFHPGHTKMWGKVSVSGGTPTLNTSYNVTSITDTATGQLTVTIANDFSSANWSAGIAVEKASTTLTVANDRFGYVRNATQAAGSVIFECCDGTAATHLAVDPAAWHFDGKGDL